MWAQCAEVQQQQRLKRRLAMSLFAMADVILKEGLSPAEIEAVRRQISRIAGIHFIDAGESNTQLRLAFNGNPETIEAIKKVPNVIEADFVPDPFHSAELTRGEASTERSGGSVYEINLGDALGEVAIKVNGATIEVHADGSIGAMEPGCAAKAQPAPGDKMPDGT